MLEIHAALMMQTVAITELIAKSYVAVMRALADSYQQDIYTPRLLLKKLIPIKTKQSLTNIFNYERSSLEPPILLLCYTDTTSTSDCQGKPTFLFQ